MDDDEQRESKWINRAGITAGVTGLGLGWTGHWAARHGVTLSEGSIWGALALTSLSMWVGMMGAAARTPYRASLVGAGILGIPGILLCDMRQPIVDQVWLVAGFSSFGSILAQVGAVAGGTAVCGNKRPHKAQFTMIQLLFFSISVAVYFGYLSTLLQR